MMRLLALAGLLLTTLPTLGQRPRITKATVFTDVDGQPLSKAAFKAQLQTGRFAVDSAQAQGAAYTSISLKKAGAPDAVRARAQAPQRTFGTAAPALALVDIDGQAISAATLRGKVVVLNFWFIRCPYCIEEMPAFKQLAGTYQHNPQVAFVSLALDKPEQLRQFLARHGSFGFAVVAQAKAVAQQFGVSSYPTTVVLDKNGLFAYDQEYTDSTARLDEAIRRAL